MAMPENAVAAWFGSQKNDARLLDQWRSAPLTYSPNHPIDGNWSVDRYEIILGVDGTGELFQRAARLVLRSRFYPAEVMVNTSDFQLEDRPVQAGDRILQRIRILMAGARPVMEVLAVNVITEVTDEPRRKGFTYTTTAIHNEIGEWSPEVIWRDNGEVALVISVVSRPRPGASALSKRITRWLQLRAHRLSIQNYLEQLHGTYAGRPARNEFVPAKMLPAGMLALALVLFLGVLLNLANRK